MKGKKISFVALFLTVLLMSSYKMNFNILDKGNDTLNSEEFSETGEGDEQILNSKEFKAILVNRKKILDGGILANQESRKLHNNLTSEQKMDLLDRSMQQGQKLYDYLEANPTERKNRAVLEKKFLDTDVLEYRNKSKLIRDKYVGTFREKEVVLRRHFNKKFPNINNDEFYRLMKLARESRKNKFKINAEKVEDKTILNSKEFKAFIKHLESSKSVLTLVQKEHMTELRNAGLNEEQIKDLSKRNREQSQKRMEYLKNHEHYAEMRRDRVAFDKKFFDEDVLAYKNKIRELAGKYNTDSIYKKQNELSQQFRDKFPNVSPENFARLLKLAKERD